MKLKKLFDGGGSCKEVVSWVAYSEVFDGSGGGAGKTCRETGPTFVGAKEHHGGSFENGNGGGRRMED
ncbi:hypothetical protein NL676_006238 [Syzygium grande]|nr:hypothetical protein NL676_006238 [Syzygium grande]